MIFIDRSIPRSVAVALKSVRDDVIWLEDAFRHDVPDVEWLDRAGRENWLVIARDKRLRTRPAEREALLRARVGCFIIAQKRDPTRWEYLKLLAATLDAMVDIHRSEERPFIYLVDAAGRLRRYLPA